MAEPCCPPPAVPAAAALDFRELDAYIAHFAADLRTRTILIPVLQKAQELFGYLPPAVQHHVAHALGLTVGEVNGVVTFYHYFSTVPKGRHTINICLGTACYVRGAKKVLDALCQELGIELGGTTADQRFSLASQRCFGACGLAPVVMVDDDVHSRVSPKKLAAILEPYQ